MKKPLVYTLPSIQGGAGGGSFIHLAETDSTNRWLRDNADGRDLVVWTDYQTAGRGSGTNTWESAPGENLLFSMSIHPTEMKAADQFRISMAISLAIVKATVPLLTPTSSLLTIKWPNDIYWRDRKLCGILIENKLTGQYVRESIIGVGLNVNQTVFHSDAPNPISLAQITGSSHSREALLSSIISHFTLNIDAADYHARLYRRQGFHPYKDAQGTFEAETVGVDNCGHLLLRDHQQHLRSYDFKKVQFVI